MIAYQETMSAYSYFENYMADYSQKLGYNWTKYDVADIEFRDGKLICKFNLLVKNEEKAHPLTYNLNFDWKTGAGGCDAGRCDGTHPEDNAQTVLTKVLNDKTGVINPGYFLTDITLGIQFYPPHNLSLGADTLLCDFYTFDESPCIYSPEMYNLYNQAKILISRYSPPENWAISRVEYKIHKTFLPNEEWRFWTHFEIRIGKITYSKQ